MVPNGRSTASLTTIRAATYWPAVAMRKEREVGTISPGKYADIIAVRGDVLRHIALLSDVDVVVMAASPLHLSLTRCKRTPNAAAASGRRSDSRCPWRRPG